MRAKSRPKLTVLMTQTQSHPKNMTVSLRCTSLMPQARKSYGPFLLPLQSVTYQMLKKSHTLSLEARNPIYTSRSKLSNGRHLTNFQQMINPCLACPVWSPSRSKAKTISGMSYTTSNWFRCIKIRKQSLCLQSNQENKMKVLRSNSSQKASKDPEVA